jgi:hypothetical protein
MLRSFSCTQACCAMNQIPAVLGLELVYRFVYDSVP